MRFFSRLGVGAALWGLFVFSCKPIEQPVSGPVSLTGEWKSITPPEPLRIGGRSEQKFCLQLASTITEMDLKNGVVLAGQRHVIEGEALDNAQTTYALQVGDTGGNIACLYRADLQRGPDFPPDRTIIGIRLRSVPALEAQRIYWRSYDTH